jgi:hypothetical protein
MIINGCQNLFKNSLYTSKKYIRAGQSVRTRSVWSERESGVAMTPARPAGLKRFLVYRQYILPH